HASLRQHDTKGEPPSCGDRIQHGETVPPWTALALQKTASADSPTRPDIIAGWVTKPQLGPQWKPVCERAYGNAVWVASSSGSLPLPRCPLASVQMIVPPRPCADAHVPLS